MSTERRTPEISKKSSKSLLKRGKGPSDKKERDALLKVVENMKTRQNILYADLGPFLSVMKPSLMHIDGVFDVFVEKRISPQETNLILRALVDSLCNPSQGSMMIAMKIVENLVTETNPYREMNTKHLIENTEIVRLISVKLKRKRTPHSALLLTYLNVLHYLCQKKDAQEQFHKAEGLNKLLFLLYTEKEEMIEFAIMKVLAIFYSQEQYKRYMNHKMEIPNVEILDKDDREILPTHGRGKHPALDTVLPSKDSMTKHTGIKHDFHKVHFSKPTFCAFCNDFIWGLGKQGYSCSICSYATHKRCKDNAPASCKEGNGSLGGALNPVLSPPSPNMPLSAANSNSESEFGRFDRSDSSGSSATAISFTTEGDYRGLKVKTVSAEIISKLVRWGSTGKVPIHHEIDPHEVQYDECIYQSVLCEVHKGKWKGTPVAIKRFDVNSIAFLWDDFFKEISLLSVIQHPKIANFYGACSKGEKPFIVIEYFPRGSLRNVVESLKAKNEPTDYALITSLAIDACYGLAFLHSHSIIHRDIKPANFLVSDYMQTKVIDFGVSRVMEDDLKMTRIGTPIWMAPEIMSDQKYTEKADIYSFALVLYEMVTGVTPYSDIDTFGIVKYVAVDKKRPTFPPNCHPEFVELISTSWQTDPQKRPSFNEILEVLYNITDPVTKEKYSTRSQRLSESVLLFVCDYLDLKDLYYVSQVCKGWYLLIENKIVEIGLRPQNRHLLKQRSEWKQSLLQRHSAKPSFGARMTFSNSSGSSPNAPPAPLRTTGYELNVKYIVQQAPVSQPQSKLLQHHRSGNDKDNSNNNNTERPQSPKTDQQKHDFEKELEELRRMLAKEKETNQELSRFKQKYEEQARLRLSVLKGSEENSNSSFMIDDEEDETSKRTSM